MQGLTKGQKQKKTCKIHFLFATRYLCILWENLLLWIILQSMDQNKDKNGFLMSNYKVKKNSQLLKRLQWEMYSFLPSPKRWQPRDITYVKCVFNNLIKRPWWPGPFLGYMYLLKQWALHKDIKISKCLNLTQKYLNFSSLNNSLMPRMYNI